MSLLTSVPNYMVDREKSFLLQVKFDDYAKLLSAISGEIAEPGNERDSATAADPNQRSARAALHPLCRFERQAE